MKYIAILTGDVINSRAQLAETWIGELKSTLCHFGDQPSVWDIHRGDSFQIQVPIEQAISAMLFIAAEFKMKSRMEIRLGIGIGEKDFSSDRISESNGTAFINSGKAFENLNQNDMVFKSPWRDFDESMNIMLAMTCQLIGRWQQKSLEVLVHKLKAKKSTQTEIAKMIAKPQSFVSRSLERTSYYELMAFDKWYQQEIRKLTSHASST